MKRQGERPASDEKRPPRLQSYAAEETHGYHTPAPPTTAPKATSCCGHEGYWLGGDQLQSHDQFSGLPKQALAAHGL